MLRRTAIVAVFVLGLVAPQMAHAQRQGNGPRPDEGRGVSEQQQAARGVQTGQYVQMAQVTSTINRRTPGRIQDSTLGNWGDRPVYHVRWATSDGKRIDYVIDARTGAILSSNGG